MPRKPLNRKPLAFYLSPEDIARLDMLAGDLPRAEWLRATIAHLHAKRFPLYSAKAQKKIMENDALAQAEGARPRKVITTTELIALAGERSTQNPHDTFYLFMLDHKGRYGGRAPFDLSQAGLDEVLPKLIEYGKLDPEFDYVYKHEPYIAPRVIAQTPPAPPSPAPTTSRADSFAEKAARIIAERDASKQNPA